MYNVCLRSDINRVFSVCLNSHYELCFNLKFDKILPKSFIHFHSKFWKKVVEGRHHLTRNLLVHWALQIILSLDLHWALQIILSLDLHWALQIILSLDLHWALQVLMSLDLHWALQIGYLSQYLSLTLYTGHYTSDTYLSFDLPHLHLIPRVRRLRGLFSSEFFNEGRKMCPAV